MTRRFLVSWIILSLAAALASCGGKRDGFRHEAHITVAKGECGVCHGRDPGAPRAAAVEDCAGCHREAIAAGGPGGNQYATVKSGAVPARQRGYADVRFPHRPHADAGILCIVCHPASNVPADYFPTMAMCRDCHAQGGVRNDCAACHKTRRTPR